MTQVTPVTGYEGFSKLIYQNMSIEQQIASSFTEVYDVQRRAESIIKTIALLLDSTGDCGGLLGWNVPKVTWVLRTSDGNVISILSQGAFPEPFLTEISSEQIVGEQSSPTPHLKAVRWIKEATGLSQVRIGQLLDVTRQTISNWEHGTPINDGHRRRLFAVRDVLERAARRYTTPAELVTWLDTPRGVDGRTPAEMLENNEIDRARLLAVSSPSPKLVRPPAWVDRPVPEAFRAGGERRQEALPPEPDNEMTDAEAATYELIEEEL